MSGETEESDNGIVSVSILFKNKAAYGLKAKLEQLLSAEEMKSVHKYKYITGFVAKISRKTYDTLMLTYEGQGIVVEKISGKKYTAYTNKKS